MIKYQRDLESAAIGGRGRRGWRRRRIELIQYNWAADLIWFPAIYGNL